LFNRSKKYIVLLVVNIVVLFALYLKYDDRGNQTYDTFDTTYVISLLQKEKELSESIASLEQQLVNLRELELASRSQIRQLQFSLKQREQKYQLCQSETLVVVENTSQN